MSELYSLTVTGAEQVKANLDRAARALRQARRVRVQEAGNFVRDHIKTSKLSGSPLKRVSGKLRSSVRVFVEETADDYFAKVKPTKHWYAVAHEEGKTITPRRARFLKIPVAQRSVIRQYEQNPAAWYTFAGSTATGWMIFGRPATTTRRALADFIPLYALKTSIRIPARPFMRPAAAECKARVIRIIGEAVDTAVREATGA